MTIRLGMLERFRLIRKGMGELTVRLTVGNKWSLRIPWWLVWRTWPAVVKAWKYAGIPVEVKIVQRAPD